VKRKKSGRNVPKEKRIKTWRIIQGDLVEVTQGFHKGKRGKVLRVLRKKDKLVVQGINVRKRHPKLETRLEGYYHSEAPISYSNVALIDPLHDKPCKVGFKYLENNEKVRISRLKLSDGTISGAIIPKPKKDLSKLEEKRKIIGPKDTLPEVALKKTFDENTLNPLKIAFYKHKEIELKD